MLNSKSKSSPTSIKPNLPSFKSLGLDLRIYPLYLSPGLRTFRRAGPKMTTLFSLLAIFVDFLAFQNFKILIEKIPKKCENQGFRPPKTIPKPFQNPLKIDVPKNMQFFIDFCSKNALLPKCQHRFRIGFYNTKWLSDVFLQVAFCMDF